MGVVVCVPECAFKATPVTPDFFNKTMVAIHNAATDRICEISFTDDTSIQIEQSSLIQLCSDDISDVKEENSMKKSTQMKSIAHRYFFINLPPYLKVLSSKFQKS